MTVIVVDVVVKSGSEVSESATCADRQQNVLSGSRAARYISLAYKCLLKRKPYQREGPLMREVGKATWGRGRGGQGRVDVLLEANVSLSVTAFTTLYAHCTRKWPPKGELDAMRVMTTCARRL